ncbi:hypothetical protein [Desulfovibrio ferrophilus]|uniref:Deoxyribodipyrimidine photolyase n=1 Tax=Desulfovibrio ferrophilus TaxID=241368 RepID=A0A2Z6B033_9BACT|nr:hypothetical protein [Desulfovibrio ferrophilus]BBD08736.1 deoxyribodipyrimidine photolyase [Desulfovibrio ferrophilus]
MKKGKEESSALVAHSAQSDVVQRSPYFMWGEVECFERKHAENTGFSVQAHQRGNSLPGFIGFQVGEEMFESIRLGVGI